MELSFYAPVHVAQVVSVSTALRLILATVPPVVMALITMFSSFFAPTQLALFALAAPVGFRNCCLGPVEQPVSAAPTQVIPSRSFYVPKPVPRTPFTHTFSSEGLV